MDIQAIHNEARTAAITAENAHIAQHGESYYCGFAWVDVFVNVLTAKKPKNYLKLALRKAGELNA
jgi:hypothetical protein